MAESKLATALIAALGNPDLAEDRINEVSEEAISTASEAELIIRLLKLFPLPAASSAKLAGSSSLRNVLGLMQRAKDKETILLFRETGGLELLRIFDELLMMASEDARLREEQDLLLFLLKVICAFAPNGGLERLVEAARSPLLKDGYLWPVIFSVVGNEQHPWETDVIKLLRDPLPNDDAAVAYLDLVNAFARSGKLASHPFDTKPGLSMLQAWLKDEENASYGHSAAASIPFLSQEAREEIQALADRHPDREVRLEAAWATAACGEARGYQTLEAACKVPQESFAAMRSRMTSKRSLPCVNGLRIPWILDAQRRRFAKSTVASFSGPRALPRSARPKLAL